MNFKDDYQLGRGRLSLRGTLVLQSGIAETTRLIAAWKRIGFLLRAVSKQSDVDPAAALAVWSVESGDWPFVPGRPVLRLECHKLWEEWGHKDPHSFDDHFQFGGRGEREGAGWTQHRFRPPGGAWQAFHGSQETEYAAFALAARLAGKEAACRASSFGGPQILGSNHGKIGYANAQSVFRAFGKSLRAQVLAFFDFCQNEDLFPALRARNWHAFARVYNGPGRVELYGEKINDAFRLARPITAANQKALSEEEAVQAFDHVGFARFVAGLGLRHFSHKEFLYRGYENSSPASAAYGLNRYPPEDLWPNIVPVAKALDAFRAFVAAPVTLQSIYRTNAYNVAVKGSAHSQHMRFAAVDLQVKSPTHPGDWLNVMKKIREQGVFSGAIAVQGNVLHVAAHGKDPDFRQ